MSSFKLFLDSLFLFVFLWLKTGSDCLYFLLKGETGTLVFYIDDLEEAS